MDGELAPDLAENQPGSVLCRHSATSAEHENPSGASLEGMSLLSEACREVSGREHPSLPLEISTNKQPGYTKAGDSFYTLV